METKPKITISTFDLAVIEHSMEETRLPPEFLDELEAELARAEVLEPAEMPER